MTSGDGIAPGTRLTTPKDLQPRQNFPIFNQRAVSDVGFPLAAVPALVIRSCLAPAGTTSAAAGNRNLPRRDFRSGVSVRVTMLPRGIVLAMAACFREILFQGPRTGRDETSQCLEGRQNAGV